MVRRRTVLQLFSSLIAWGSFSTKTPAGAVFGDEHAVRLRALAEAVLPREAGRDSVTRAADQFIAWVHEYRAFAEADHEYGSSELSRLPPAPSHDYTLQLDDLDRRTMNKTDGSAFAAASLTEQQRAVADAIAAAGVKELPGRPDGGHIATDLMAYYFNSSDANDLVHERLIGRFACGGLPGSDQRPPVLRRSGGAK